MGTENKLHKMGLALCSEVFGDVKAPAVFPNQILGSKWSLKLLYNMHCTEIKLMEVRIGTS